MTITNVRKLLRDIRTTYELVVGPTGVRYSEYPVSRKTADPRKTISLSSAQIERVFFEHQIAEQPAPIRIAMSLARFIRSRASGGTYR